MKISYRKKYSNSMSCLKVSPLEMDANNRPSISTSSEPAFVEFIEADIPGAALDETLARPDRLLDVFFCSFALVALVSWSQASTFVEKATVDFKVGSFSTTHELLACLPNVSTNSTYTLFLLLLAPTNFSVFLISLFSAYSF